MATQAAVCVFIPQYTNSRRTSLIANCSWQTKKSTLCGNEAFVSGAEYSWEYAPNFEI